MEEVKEVQFLQPSVREIRKSIIDIDDSYNNDWDILAELCQNSTDAIRKRNIENGSIIIEVNALNKSISCSDNGIGIDSDRLPVLLAPFSSDKEGDAESIGEKGVGLTFVLFSCNDFHIKTGTDSYTVEGEVSGALHWKEAKSNEMVKIKISKSEEQIKGTHIKLNGLCDLPLFQLSFQQLKYILRTKTAIGNTLKLWDNDQPNINVNLKFVDLNGKYYEETIENKFWLVHEHLDKNSKTSLDDFITYAKEAGRTDIEKRKFLQDKLIYKKDSISYKGREVKYYTYFVPKRKVWEDLSLELGLCTESDLKVNNKRNDEWYDEFGYSIFSPGIYTSVKGMPTGISIEHPSTGYAGYWSNIFIMFEDRHLKFDIGRKSIHGMTGRIYKNFARDIFNEYLHYITKYVSGEINTVSDWEKDEVFEEIENLVDLKNKNTSFKKTPKDQEASVAAIFYECIGNGTIKDYQPLISGYRNRYDLYAKWKGKRIVIEFKSKLKNILRDFSDEQKLFDEIDVIVCWNVSEDDKQSMKNVGIELDEITHSVLSERSKKIVPHATHELILSGFNKPIFILDLEKISEKE